MVISWGYSAASVPGKQHDDRYAAPKSSSQWLPLPVQKCRDGKSLTDREQRFIAWIYYGKGDALDRGNYWCLKGDALDRGNYWCLKGDALDRVNYWCLKGDALDRGNYWCLKGDALDRGNYWCRKGDALDRGNY